jgi:hypothetical protein
VALAWGVLLGETLQQRVQAYHAAARHARQGSAEFGWRSKERMYGADGARPILLKHYSIFVAVPSPVSLLDQLKVSCSVRLKLDCFWNFGHISAPFTEFPENFRTW